MKTINKSGKTAGARGNPQKKKPNVSEIYMDIKNGVAAREILQKHQISLQQLKMIMMHCYKKGLLKKNDLVKYFNKKPSAKNVSDNVAGVAIQMIARAVNSVVAKFKNEKIIGGLFPLTPQNICALCLILFFFSPWVSVGGFATVSGFKIPAAVKSLGELAQILDQARAMSYKVYILYILYFIPILGALTIYLNSKRKDSRAVGMVAAAIPIAMLIYMFVVIGADNSIDLASGAYLTFLASAAIIIETVYGLEKLKKKLIKIAAAKGLVSDKSSSGKSEK